MACVGPVQGPGKAKRSRSPNGYKITGEGEGGVAGFAKGGATGALADQDGGTLLTCNEAVSSFTLDSARLQAFHLGGVERHGRISKMEAG